MTKSAAFATGLTLIALAQSPTTASTAHYDFYDLGVIDGVQSIATAINDSGSVAGSVTVMTAYGRSVRPARAINGGAFEYITGLEAVSGAADGVNASGDLTGNMELSPFPNWSVHAMRYHAASGAVDDLGTLGGSLSFGYGINSTGVVAGWSTTSTGRRRGFVAVPGSAMQDVGAFGGDAASSFASDVNDLGQVAGHAQTAEGRYHAFRYTAAGGLVDLDLRPTGDSFAEEINEAGQVVGRFITAGSQHAFRYSDGIGMQDLDGVSGRSSSAFSINDQGDVVGYVLTASGPRAFLYSDETGMIDLNSMLDPASGWTLFAAYGINNAGEIVGEGAFTGDAQSRGFKLTPRRADATPPTITEASANPALLWPPNGWMHSVAISVSAYDEVDPSPRCHVSTVGSNEALGAEDAVITGALSVKLRAARLDSGKGRIYTVDITCLDSAANEASTTVTVLVPHSMSK